MLPAWLLVLTLYMYTSIHMNFVGVQSWIVIISAAFKSILEIFNYSKKMIVKFSQVFKLLHPYCFVSEPLSEGIRWWSPLRKLLGSLC